MRIRSEKELKELDEDLITIDEPFWDFLKVNGGDNAEYFNDIIDTNFKCRTKSRRICTGILSAVGGLVLLVGGIMLALYVSKAYLIIDGSVSSVNDITVVTEHVKGNSVSNEDFVDASSVIYSYFDVLSKERSYSILDNFCMTGSTFNSTESSFRSKMTYAFDINDCYSRIMRCYGSYFKINEITEVVEKSGIYYVYLSAKIPDEKSLVEYFYKYSYDITKEFKTTRITEQNIVKYLIHLANTFGLDTTANEMCLQMSRNLNNDFAILDDSLVTNRCISSYNYAISQAVKLLTAYNSGVELNYSF